MFVAGAVGQALGYGAYAVAIWVMVDHFGGIGAWSSYEVMLLWGLNLFSYSTAGVFCLRSFYGLGQMIRTGEFDNVLTKPPNPLLFIAFRQFNYGYFSHLSVATFVIALSWVKIGIALTWGNLCFLAVTLFSGAIIHAAVFLATGVPAFWIVQNEALAALLLWDVGTFTRYPVTIYPKPIQVILTCVLPYGFVAFYPAQFFLGKTDFSLFHPVFQYLSPVVALVAAAAAYQFWRFGLTRYQSTGS